MNSVGRTPNPTPTPRAAWVRYVREDVAKMTQIEFAEALGVARPTVSHWETGDYEPSWENQDVIMRRFPDARPPPIGLDRGRSLDEAPARLTFASLHDAIERWAGAAGDPHLIDDDLFIKGLLDLFMDYRRRYKKK